MDKWRVLQNKIEIRRVYVDRKNWKNKFFMIIYKKTYFTAFMIPLEEFKNLRRKENLLVGLIPDIESANKMSNIEVFRNNDELWAISCSIPLYENVAFGIKGHAKNISNENW